MAATIGKPPKWNLSYPLELAGSIPIPLFDKLENDLHINLFCANKQGDLVLLGEKGQLVLVNLQTSKPTLIHLHCEVPLFKSQNDKIHQISFNSTGDKLLCRGDYFLKVITLPDRDMGGELLERPSLSDLLVNFNDGTSKFIQLKNTNGLTMDDLKGAEKRCREQGISNLKSVSRDIYKVQVFQCGHYDEVGTPRINQATWHPHIPDYIMVLDATRSLSLYNVEDNYDLPEQRFPLETSLNVGTPISFCFGSEKEWERFTLFVLYTSGATFALCPILPKGFTAKASFIRSLMKQVNARLTILKRTFEDIGKQVCEELSHEYVVVRAQKYWLETIFVESNKEKNNAVKCRRTFGAPLESDEEQELDKKNSGYNDDETIMITLDSSITGISTYSWPLRLQGPFLVSPQSIVEGNHQELGAVAQSICCLPSDLPNDKDILSCCTIARVFSSGHLELLRLNGPIYPVWNTTNMSKANPISVPVALLVKCVQLGINNSGGAAELRTDPCHPDLLYCHHSTGVHLICVPWIKSLSLKTLKSLPFREIFSCSPDEISTKIRSVVGFVLFDTPTFGHILLIRLSTGSIEAINVTVNKHLTRLKKDYNIDNTETSKISSMKEVIPFSKIVNDVCEKVIPVASRVKCKTKLQDVDEVTIEFMIKISNQLQQDSMLYLIELNEKMNGRMQLLQDSFSLQQEEIRKLKESLQACEAKGLEESRRIMDIVTMQENVKKRSAAVLQALQDNQPVLSKAEKEYQKQLERINHHLFGLKPKITELKIRASRICNVPRSDVIEKKNYMPQTHQKMCFDALAAVKLLLSEAQLTINQLDDKFKSVNI